MRADFERRILRAIELMQRPGGVTVQDLSRELEISRKTFYSLLSHMQDMSIPVYDKSDYEGKTNSKRWHIREDWNRPLPLILEPHEQIVLRLALERLKPHPSESNISLYKEISRRISDAWLSSKQEKKFLTHSSFKGGKLYAQKQELINTLFECVDKRWRASVTYQAAQVAEAKTYVIEPLTIVDHNNGLYVIVAIPKHNRDIRVLAIERIQKLEPLPKESFKLPEGYSPEDCFSSSFGIIIEDPIRVRACFTPNTALYAAERVWGQEQELQYLEDRSLELSFSACGFAEILRWALSWGADIHVLEPPELVEAVAAAHLKAANQYSR